MAATTAPSTRYHLVRASGGVTVPPTLDEHQQAVVDHPGGPLLVLAGPGTGKTTTMVEAIAELVERRGVHPDQVLALTFSRKAAEQLRDRVIARVGRTTSSATCSTFHSFAYQLIRAHSPLELYDAPLRLLSAPESDVVLRELLSDNPEAVVWPEALGRALGTRGFTKEVHAVLSRAREKGLDPTGLEALGRTHGLPEFVAAGQFLEQYLTILDNLGATDHPDLIRRAVIIAEAHRDELRARFSHVFVDEYQDTDPGQVSLLRALAGDGRNLTVVGDPHQSIYGFRGADVHGILDFPDQFPTTAGERAPVQVLRRTRRFGPRLLVAAGRIAGRLPLTGSIGAEARDAFLTPEAVPGPHGEGRVEVHTFDTDRAESEHLADLLRRAHLEDGIDWSEMAVLVRSGRASIPPLRRALVAAGVPVEVASDDVPLVRDPAVLPLLDGLRAVVNLDNTDPDSPDFLDPGRIEALLLSPLGGLDAGDLRALVRRLRARDKEGAAPRTSRELLRLAVVEDGFLGDLEGPEVERCRALATLLRSAAALLERRASVEEVLWHLWDGTGWPERLRRQVDQGGAGARRAHKDLDSIVALFEVTARAVEHRDHVGVADFFANLVAQQIPGDTLAERGVRGSAVRLLTAHRSKGLEWELVVVAHVQQEGWPDLRRRSSLLGADRIGLDPSGAPDLVPPVTSRALLMEERRLFYVACTRARRRLVVTAVKSTEDDGEQPSRFLAELELTPIHRDGRPPRPLSLGGLVAELRRTVADPATSPALREAAARRLAALAGEEVAGRPLVPQADPGSWWGTRAASRSVQPVRDADRPVPVSASMLESLLTCPAQWFFSREAGGVSAAHQAVNLGQIVHALAERVATGELTADVDVLMAEVDAVWGRLAFRTPWSRKREHDRIRKALARFVQWHEANPRELVGTESRFRSVVEVDGQEVTLNGTADRLELTADGEVVVVDFKTNRTAPSAPAVKANLQLALYQLAVDSGALDEVVGRSVGSGGAELVQLGLNDDTTVAKVQAQEAHADDGAEREVLRAGLARAATLVREETFPAVPGAHCRDCTFVPICPAKGAGSVTVQ
ncbi:ATP-dependent helicase [Nocardioides currus]|uniref:DNA 3'-5' helicase n=1 Tax=Nocardioides currus TaxID=2133958 RepID=A0A2R7Z078_9ACTN|nr:ATP-dependent DNA helicase [Nocardioides currus]PUA82015.1 ATP-dependent helicase [Nocardioides currus]